MTRLLAPPCFQGLVSLQTRRSNRVVTRDAPSGQQPTNENISEQLIARLKAAEEEAQRLKKELAAAKADVTVTAVDASEDAVPKSTRRIDGGDLRRETIFSESKSRNWLSESDVDFFTGGGPSEAEGAEDEAQSDAAIVRRRIIIGTILTIGAGAFALVPTERLQPAPSKPLFFYLVPLIRSQGLLEEVEKVIPEGDYQQLRTLLARIEGPPNSIQDNLRSAASSLPDSRAANDADMVARDVYEYVKGIDYQTYYDSVGGGGSKSKGGSGEKELFDYSQKSAGAARRKLKEFLALMPRDQVEAAEQQANTLPF